MKFLYFITLFAILHTQTRLVSPDDSNLILAKAKSLLENIYTTSTKVVPALPLKMATSAVNLVCKTFHDFIQKHIPAKFTPKLENIKLQLRTACARREYPLSDLSGLAADKDFDRKKKTVIISTGWNTQLDNIKHDMLAKAYNCRGDTNYLALDFSDYIHTLYTWSSENTNTIGAFVAKGLQKLLTFIDVADLHLMGHSLGAQIMGSAARHYRMLTGKSLPYVTGLDPALPCFSMHKGLITLSSQDADFVDIIHTNPGVLGQYENYGHVDFYVGGTYPIKNGCTKPRCSHSIVVPYYTESVYPNNNRDFTAKQCASSKRLNCNGAETVMGFAVSRNARGTYTLDTNAEAPYGKNAGRGYTDPNSSKCGTCQG